MNNIQRLDCFSVEDLLAEKQSVLILSNNHCNICKDWIKQLNQAIDEGRLPENIKYGILNINQKGLIPFKRENPWVEEAVCLPYTALLINGVFQLGIVGRNFEQLVMMLK